MTEERITRVESPEGDTHSTTTIIRDTPAESSGGTKWIVLLVAIIAIGIGIYAFAGVNDAQIAKDTAIADAANSVGNAADKAGNAVEQVADEVTGEE